MKNLPTFFGRSAASLSKDVEDLMKTVNSVWLDAERAFEDFDKMFPVGIRNVNFPPCDIAKTETGYLVSLAVAGFSRDDLSVEVDGDNVITVSGKKETKSSNEYLVKGIATRQFVRKWQLQSADEVTDVKFEDGLLNITIQRNEPVVEETPVKRLEIK